MKRFLLIGVLIVMTSAGQAQSLAAQFGFNFSNLVGDIDTATLKLGFQGGVAAEFQFGKNFYVQPELVFTLQGAIDSEHAEDKVSLNYVALPIVAKYFLSRGFNVQFGPRVGMLVMAQVTLDETDIQIKDQLGTWDYGVVFGTGYQKKSWGVSARYYHGFSDIYEATEGVTIRNQMLQITVAYYLIDKRKEVLIKPSQNRR